MSRREDELERLLLDILDWLRFLWRQLKPQARTGQLTYQGDTNMGTATLTFTDATGASQPAPTGDGSGLVVTFSATDPSVITFDAATVSGDTATANGTRLTDAAFTLNAVVSNTSGAPLLDDDGTTPFQQPGAIDVPAVTPPPSQATTGVITFSE